MKIKSFERYYHYKKSSAHVFDGHRHAGFEANIVLFGELEVTCADKVFRLKAGEMAVWWAGMFHRNRVISAEDTEFISLHFFSETKAFALPTLFSLNALDLALVSVIDDELMEKGSAIGRITEASEQLLGGLISRLENREMTKAPYRDPASELYRKAVGIMEDSIEENLSVSDIARRCGVCVTLLKNAFAEYAGKGVKEYYIEMKIERAKNLLMCGKHAEAVSAKLGFSSPSYFSQTFKRISGMSPRGFLKENLN